MAPRSASENKRIRQARAEQIRDAALALFSSQGFHNTTISEVAKRAKVSKGLMYSYFDSKDALLESIVMGLAEESYTFAEELAKLKTPREKIVATLNYSIKAMENRPDEARMLLLLVLHGDTMGQVSKYAGGATRELIRFYVAILTEAGVPEPELETYLLVSALDGLGVHYVFFKQDEQYPWEAIKQKFIENTLNHLNL